MAGIFRASQRENFKIQVLISTILINAIFVFDFRTKYISLSSLLKITNDRYA